MKKLFVVALVVAAGVWVWHRLRHIVVNVGELWLTLQVQVLKQDGSELFHYDLEKQVKDLVSWSDEVFHIEYDAIAHELHVSITLGFWNSGVFVIPAQPGASQELAHFTVPELNYTVIVGAKVTASPVVENRSQ